MATQAGVAYVTVQYDPASVQRLRATTEAEGQRMASRWSGFASRASGLLVRGAGVAVAVGLYKAVSAAADFQKQLNVLQAVSGATASQMHKISDEAIRLGADVKLPATSAQDAAVAMTELAKGGLSVRDSMAAARGTLELAAAGQIDVGDAAQVTANTLNQFALRGTDAAHVADLLAGAANVSSGDVSDFAASLVYAGTASHAAGQSVDLTVAALAEMANAGIQGSIAGTSLANAMRALQAPTAKARDELHKLGIDVYDAHGKMLPLDKLADTFTKHLHGLTQQQQNAALATLFGTRSVQAARAVLLQGGDALDKYRDKVSKQGNAQRLAEAQTKGFRGALQGLESTAETLGIQIGLKLLPPLTTFTRDLTSALPGAVSTATSAVEAFGPPVAFLADNFGTLQPFIIGTVAALATLKVATLAASAATSVYGAVTATLSTAQILLTEGTSGLAAAQALQSSATATTAAANSAATASTFALATAQTAFTAALEGTITAETAVAIGAAAATAAEEAQGAAAVAAAAEVGVLDAAMLATPWGLAAVGIAGAVGLAAAFISLRGSTDPLASTFDSASSSVDRMTGALNRERDAAHALITDQLDVKDSSLAVQRSQAQEAATSAMLTAARRKLNQMAQEGLKGTKAYAAQQKAVNAAQLDASQAANDAARAELNLSDARAKARVDLKKEKGSIDASAKSVKGFSASLDDAIGHSRGMAVATQRASSRFGFLSKSTKQAAGFSENFASKMVDLNAKVTAAIPKLARQAHEAQNVASNFGKSQSAAAQAARAYAANADAAVRAARKLRELTGVAGDLANALGRIPSKKTIDIYETVHTADRRQRKMAGGPVTADTSYIVGEAGPELFVPTTNGNIVPNNRLATVAPEKMPWHGTAEPIILHADLDLGEGITKRVKLEFKRTKRTVQAGSKW